MEWREQEGQTEEKRLWRILECDAEQVREDKRAMKKQKRKEELARSKMKAGKDQPSNASMEWSQTVSQDYNCEWDKPV